MRRRTNGLETNRGRWTRWRRSWPGCPAVGKGTASYWPCWTLVVYPTYRREGRSGNPLMFNTEWIHRLLVLCSSTRCDDKAFKKLMSNFGSSRSEESCSAVVELLERVTKLHKQLELKESQAEIDMDQVQNHCRRPSHQGGLLQYPPPCYAGSICSGLFFLDSAQPCFTSLRPFVAVCMVLR